MGIGTDISALAHFIAEVKTRPLSPTEGGEVLAWLERTVGTNLSIRRRTERPTRYIEQGYQRHLNSHTAWRLRKLIEMYISSVSELPDSKTQAFARCIALRVGQWALDGRGEIPSFSHTRERLLELGREMVGGSVELWHVVSDGSERTPRVTPPICLHRSAVGVEQEPNLPSQSPRLIVTSPPYPGVYVTYHRWKVRGRLETAAPFWIANSLDGMGLSYYNLGDRRRVDRPGPLAYWERAAEAFSSVQSICDTSTVMVQLVGFSEPRDQLPRYLAAMEAAGFREYLLPGIDSEDGRLYRSIPNRRWYAAYQSSAHETGREVVLFHRVA